MGKLWEIVEDRGAWCAEVYWVTKSQTQFSDRTTTIYIFLSTYLPIVNTQTRMVEAREMCSYLGMRI